MPKKSKQSREKIINITRDPLGFFVLTVLVVEGFLSIVACFSEGFDRTMTIALMFIIILCLICIVAFMAYFRPASLYGLEAKKAKSDELTSSQKANINDGKEMLNTLFGYMNNGHKVSETFRVIEETFQKSSKDVKNEVSVAIECESVIDILINNTKQWLEISYSNEKSEIVGAEFLAGHGLITIANISTSGNNNIPEGHDFINSKASLYIKEKKKTPIDKALKIAKEIIKTGKRNSTLY